MTNTCDCGAEITAKNAAGHYRTICRACLRQIAATRTTHVEQCDDPECLVCTSWWDEQ